MKSKAMLALLLATAYSASALATDYDKYVDRLGIQGNSGYFSVKDTLSLSCKFDVVYVDLTNDFGKAAYASLLAAQTSGKKLSRLDYSQTVPGEMCMLTLLESKS